LKGLFTKKEKQCNVCEGKGFCTFCKGKGEVDQSKIQPAEGDLAKCGNCGAIVPTNLPECSGCGVSFSGEWFECPMCRTNVSADSMKCKNCGAEFE
jgi:RNA polymerase subunit RPABC4/transcription elongation factor Spt4